jgi:hypothetical protein
MAVAGGVTSPLMSRNPSAFASSLSSFVLGGANAGGAGAGKGGRIVGAAGRIIGGAIGIGRGCP